MTDQILIEDERLCDEIEEYNNSLLAIFAKDLQAQGCKKGQIENHLFNAHNYINLFLFTGSDAPHTMEQGIDRLDEYFGYFFIRKCMWSSVDNLQENTESVRLFYRIMMEHGFIGAKEYGKVEEEIQDKISEWREEMLRWNRYQSTTAPTPTASAK